MVFAGLLLATPVALSAAEQNPFLAELMGRVQLILGEDYVVSGQKLDGVAYLWVNARVGLEQAENDMDVLRPRRVKMVPAEGGIVFEFTDPFVLLEKPHARYETRNLPGKGTVEIFITVSEKLAMVVKGRYGKQFPQKHVEEILKVSKTFARD